MPTLTPEALQELQQLQKKIDECGSLAKALIQLGRRVEKPILDLPGRVITTVQNVNTAKRAGIDPNTMQKELGAGNESKRRLEDD